jgi:hypothetical protein
VTVTAGANDQPYRGEGANESVAFPTEGERDGCFKVGFPWVGFFDGTKQWENA